MYHEADFKLTSYQYDLPESQIAQNPVQPPESAKLMVFDRADESVDHRIFADLPGILKSGDSLFFNDSRVLPARIVRDDFMITRPSGVTRERSAELLYLRSHDETHFESMVFPGDYFPVGTVVALGKYRFRVDAITYEGRTFELLDGENILSFLMEYGRLPLPPYIEYDDEKAPMYQTVFAKNDGSLAAPTASLHFSEKLLSDLDQAWIRTAFATLHVGIGTFKIMNTTDIRDHEMHEEYFEVTAELFERIADLKNTGGRVIAVGTTMVRTLESLPCLWPMVRDQIQVSSTARIFWDTHSRESELVRVFSADANSVRAGTKIFIYPGYRFTIVDAIITNFHLPESTLLCMISAFIGREKLFELYDTAIENKYRFYSFWDGMFIG